MTSNEKGRIGLASAINYFTLQGYTILLPLNDTQNYDLAIEKNGVIKTVQCKATWEKSKNNNDSYELSLRTTGGTKGTLYYTLADTNVDLLFCYRGDGVKYLIPVNDLKEYRNTIRLVTKRSEHSCSKLHTEKYIVE